MRILCVLDWPVRQGARWLWDSVPGNQDVIDFAWIAAEDRFARWGKLLSYYPAHIALARRVLRACERREYDVVVAWEGKNGFPLALARAVTGKHVPPLVILAFSVRGPVTNFRPLMRYATRRVDHITVPTNHEKEHYTRLLHLAPSQVSFCPLGVYDLFGRAGEPESREYVFSGGRSGRDYGTLFAAIQDTQIPLVVNARPFNLRGLQVPPNVSCKDIQPLGLFGQQLRQSRFVVVPLMDLHEAVGLSSILYAMAAGRAVIATRAPGVSDYVEHGETGWLVEAGDPGQLRQAIEYLWTHPDVAGRLGAQARDAFVRNYTFEAFAQRAHDVITRVVQSSKDPMQTTMVTEASRKAAAVSRPSSNL